MERQRMAKIPMQIGGIDFAKKGDAMLFFREMLNRYRPGEMVSDTDARLLSALLARHPEAKDKAGAGVTGFKVRSADWGTQCFWVMRSDGSSEKFSFYACL